MADPSVSPTPATSPSATDSPATVGWIPPAEGQRAQLMKDLVPRLVADKLELRWLTNDQAATHAAAHLSVVSTKSNLKSLRPAQTKALAATVKKMSKPLGELRLVMKKKFKEALAGYYPQFGLVLSSDEWRLPKDYDELESALREKLLPALTTYGFQDDPDTGTAVWQPLWQELKTALRTARGLDAERSEQVGITRPQDETTTLFLRCVVHLVQAHFPQTWENVLRGWGWNKTSF